MKYYWSMTEQDLQQIGDCVRDNNNMAVDDSTGKVVELVGLFKNKNRIVGALLSQKDYVVRGVYISTSDKKPHISKAFIGDRMINNNIPKYNDTVIFSKYRIIESIYFE